MSDTTKIFDNYKDLKQVDCEECEHLYTGACDGLSEGSTKPCACFQATRRVVTLDELKALREDCRYIKRGLQLTLILFIAHILINLAGSIW